MLLLLPCWLFACERKAPPAPSAATETPPAAQPEAIPAPEVIPLEPPVEVLRVANSGLPCAVDEVLAAKCRRCHTLPARHSAPFPLLTWEDTQQLIDVRPRFKVMEKVVQTGYMPYGIPANPPVQPLTDAEKQTLVAWAQAGAPKGAACGATPAMSAEVHSRPTKTSVIRGANAPPPHTR